MMSMSVVSILGSLGETVSRFGDSTERGRVQASSAHERTVHVGAAEQGGGVFGLHGAAVENPCSERETGLVTAQPASNGSVYFLRLGGAGVLSRSDGPHRLVSDGGRGVASRNHFAKGFHLALDDPQGFSLLPL